LLTVEDARAGYGESVAVRGMSIDVQKRELVALIGPNGAGKTTLMLAISGLIRLTGGSITFESTRIERLRSHEIVALGISHVPQGRHVFPGMTVEENLEVGACRLGRSRNGVDEKLDEIYTFFPALRNFRQAKAGRLSGGQQQMVAIGRALMADPRLLLLDEPSTGLAPIIVEGLIENILALRDRGLSILLVEQNAEIALDVADRVFVMSTGRLRASGLPSELKESDEVQTAYLGTAAVALER
jgi:branched-chain amino acid transport system ATP-binding protein